MVINFQFLFVRQQYYMYIILLYMVLIWNKYI